jgi:tetrahydromethanopterin S-methyltransferase subunit D
MISNIRLVKYLAICELASHACAWNMHNVPVGGAPTSEKGVTENSG